jgi:tetrahydromethanopterin S-methyltransferase subunit B
MNNFLFEKTINNLHDNGKVSFKKLKEIIQGVSTFVLEKKPELKGKKILLSFSVKEGKILIAENKNSIKNNKKNIFEYLKTCENLKEQISNSLNILENNINSMNQEDQISLFGLNGNVFYSIELLTKPENCIDYNTKYYNILPDGHGEYNDEGKEIVKEVSRQVSKLQETINNLQNKLKYEKYNQQTGAIRKLYELNDKEYYNFANNKIDNSLSSVNSYIQNDNFLLNDDSTVDDYMLSRMYVLLNAILDKSQTQKFNSIVKMNIAKRLLGIKGISSYDITKKLDDEQEEYLKKNILNDKNKKDILKNAIKPIEDVVINYCLDILKAVEAILLLSNNPQSRRLIKQINNSINYINTGNTFSTTKQELKNLKHVDRYLNKPNLSFYYDGNEYNTSGNFKPINELLKIFKPFSENINDKKLIDENNLYDIINETVSKRGNKYCLLSKKTKKNLGCYTSLKKVKKREQQIQYFKHIKEMSSASAGAVQGFGAGLENTEQENGRN